MIKVKGLVADCKTGKVEEVEIDFDNTGLIEQELLDSLIPSEKEMLMAEVEIQTITILMEVGLI